jgi:drug/metabolite transporter (DMT)-like permease
MKSELIIAILAGLGGMFGWGIADFFAKKTIDKIGATSALFYSQLVGIFPLLVIFLIRPIGFFNKIDFLSVLIVGILTAIYYFFLYASFGKGNVSVLSPIMAASPVLVVMALFFVFGEELSFNQFLIFITVFIGMVLIAGDLKSIWSAIIGRETKLRGLREVIIALIVDVVALVYLDRFLGEADWVFILLGVKIFMTLSIFIYANLKKENLYKLNIEDKNLWGVLLLIGLLDVIAFSSIFYGISATSHTGIIAMLSGAFSLPTIFLARIFLKEKITNIQAIGVALIILGVMVLAFL